jgi:hypothetical protein
MTNYLLYWKTFWAEVDDFRESNHDWHTDNWNFFNNVEEGDVFWVIINGGPEAPDEWRLISRSVVAMKDPIINTRSRRYHIIADDEGSTLFDPTWQGDLAPILKQLTFQSNKRIKRNGKLIGRTLQIARRLTEEDITILHEYARSLSTDSGEQYVIDSSLRPAALAEDGYYRETPQKLSFVLREHNKLSNEFAAWLEAIGYFDIKQEENYVDVVFKDEELSYRAELKVCSGVGSTKAIREALGQLLEYNFYPGREQADRWVIILDRRVTDDDVEYIGILKEALDLPLCLGWRERGSFIFADGLELEDD